MKRQTIQIFTLIILFLSSTQAADIYGICVTAVAPSTTFLIETKDQKINFEIINHNGGGYAPFWNTPVVPNDLFRLSEKADLIKKIDIGFKSTWPVENCKWHGKNKFSCFGTEDKVTVNGIQIEPWGLYSSAIKDSSFAGDYSYVEMSVAFIVNNETQYYTMKYQSDECILSEKPIAKLDKFKKMRLKY